MKLRVKKKKNQSEWLDLVKSVDFFLNPIQLSDCLSPTLVGMKTRFIENLTGSRDTAYNDLTLGSPPAK